MIGRCWAALVVVLGAPLVLATPATADVVGSCDAAVAGVEVRGRSASDPSDAVDVDADAAVRVGATAPGAIERYVVEMEFGGVRWEVAEGTTDGSSWEREVDVADYARFGVGLYRVRGSSFGSETCVAEVLVHVTGRHPLTTVAGVGSAAVAAASVAGSSMAARSAARRMMGRRP